MKGLYGKYVITKADGSPVDPSADYFVLRLDTDPAARAAARTYARNMYYRNQVLADELEARCAKHSWAALEAKEKARK
jgi:hypothetical protein